MEMYTLQCVLILVAFVHQSNGDPVGSVRLSDFPVIKRWEIPLKANVVGRRHKDLWAENKKKRSFWEAKPQFTLHELEADEDPEKVYMDLHYSRNMLEEDNDDRAIAQSKKNTISNNKGEQGFVKTGKAASTQKLTRHKIGDKKRLIALKPFLSAKHVIIASKKRRKRRHRRSIEDEEDEEDVEEEGFQDALMEENLVEAQGEQERVKRSSQSLADFYFDQYDDIEGESIRAPENLDNIDPSDTEDEHEVNQEESDGDQDEGRDREKRSDITSATKQKSNNKKIANTLKEKRAPHEENLSKVFKKTGASKVRSSTVEGAKRGGAIINSITKTDTDQKKIAKALIQKAFFASKHGSRSVPVKNTVRHIIPQSSSSVKQTIPNVDVKFVSKSLSGNGRAEVTSSGLKKDSSMDLVTRQQISHTSPEDKSTEKSTDGINTANVARAVAVAMEQLKRDKMWGKVFVHVRPTGELKVMVQETKKMEEN